MYIYIYIYIYLYPDRLWNEAMEQEPEANGDAVPGTAPDR